MQQVWIKWSEKCQKNLSMLAYKKLENKIKMIFLQWFIEVVLLLLQTEKQTSSAKEENEL
jgi:hypothetical protein